MFSSTVSTTLPIQNPQFQKFPLVYFMPQSRKHPKAAGFKNSAHSAHSKYIENFLIVCKVHHREM